MAKGDGSIQLIKKNVYRVSVSLGKDPVTKKYRRITRTVHGTKADARRVRDEIKRDLEDGLKIDVGDVTFARMVSMWEEAKRTAGQAADDTITGYVRQISRIVDMIGEVPVAQVDSAMIDSVFAKLREETALSGTTLKQMFDTVKGVMQKAEDYDLIRRNPCNRCEAPKRNKPTRKAISADECTRLKAALDAEEDLEYAKRDEIEAYHDKYQADRERSSLRGVMRISCIIAARIILATGLRRGEALALTWKRLDVRNARLEIVDARNKRGGIKETKTEAGGRIVAIDSDTLKHLMKWKAYQKRCFSRIGIDVTSDTPICCSNVCGLMEPGNFESWWRKFRKSNGFEGLVLHELRHTQATLLLANGTDVKTVQTRMGHASAAFTLDRYAHAVPEKDDQAADLMGGIMAGEVRQKARIISLKTA